MLNAYLNQTAEYSPCTGSDDRGQPVYGDAEVIRCRKQLKMQNVLTATGQVIKAQHIYYCSHSVAEGDMLDGRVVVAVEIWSGLSGEIIGYKAVL